MRLRSIAIGLCAVFLICDQGYCLFRDDVGAPQVYSAIKMQRAKDEQRKNEAEQVKPQAVSEEIEQNDKTYNAQINMSASSLAFPAAVTSPESIGPVPQYKRLTPQGTVVDTPRPVLVQSAKVESKIEPSNLNQGFIVLLLVLLIAGFIIFKQRGSK